MGDVEDPYLYASEPIWQWQQTDQGQWVTAHAKDLIYRAGPDPSTFGYRITIYGQLDDQHATEYFLRWNSIEYS